MQRYGVALAAGMALLGMLVAGGARADHDIYIETRGGFNAARWTGGEASQISGPVRDKTGFVLGVGVHVPLNPRFTLEPEVSYVMKGTSFGNVTDPVFDGTTYVGTFNQLWAMDYLELPVLLRANLSNGPIRPVLVGGPFVAWKALEKQRLNGPGDDDYEGKSDDMRLFDYGLTAGVACEIGHLENCITLEARYTTSLGNVPRPQFDGTLHNSDVRFLVGWKQRFPGLMSVK
jgi:hypothetical protein